MEKKNFKHELTVWFLKITVTGSMLSIEGPCAGDSEVGMGGVLGMGMERRVWG